MSKQAKNKDKNIVQNKDKKKVISLKSRIFKVFAWLVLIAMVSVAGGVCISHWMEGQYSLLSSFTGELNQCLTSKEKVAYLRGEYILASIGSKKDIPNIKTQCRQIEMAARTNIDGIFSHSRGCRQCHSQEEITALHNRTINSFKKFVALGNEIFSLAAVHPASAQAVVKNKMPAMYMRLQSIIGHGVEESNKFVSLAKSRVVHIYRVIGLILFILGFSSVAVAVFGGISYYHKVILPLKNMSKLFGSVAFNVMQVAQEQSASASKQADSVMEAGASAEELNRAADALSKQAAVIVKVADRSMQKAMEVTERMHSTTEFMDTVKSYADASSNTILSLNQTIDEVGKVLTLIEDVASQTRLLAFNAAIEAVSAGEAGKRFSIVAKHIKDLAENTSSSTDEIRKLIEEVRRHTQEAVLTTESVQKTVNEAVSQVSKAGMAIEQIRGVIHENHDVAQKINIATSQQGKATSQITEAMDALSVAAKSLEKGSRQTVERMQEMETAVIALKELIGN